MMGGFSYRSDHLMDLEEDRAVRQDPDDRQQQLLTPSHQSGIGNQSWRGGRWISG